MAQLGAALMVLGGGSALLHLIDYELRVLFWVTTWGSGPAWAIRATLLLAGLALVVVAVLRERARPSTALQVTAAEAPPTPWDQPPPPAPWGGPPPQ